MKNKAHNTGYLSSLLLFVFWLSGCQNNPTKLEQLASEVDTFDLHIQNGTVIDGTGNAPFKGDILVYQGSIAYVGAIDRKITAKQLIDAKGKVVSPGFIDTHAHGNPLKTPDFHNFLAMGVTTISLGQDGDSPVDFNSHFSKIEAIAPGVNILYFAGHGSLRMASGIRYDSIPSQQQLEDMGQLLEKALKAGCYGMSTGLEYNPGYFASEEELAYLAQLVNRHEGLIMSHVRNEDDAAIEASLHEFFKQGEFCPIHISHLKVVYGKGRERASEILTLIQQAKNKGMKVSADVYPYTASYTGIGIVFPEWAKPPYDYQEVISQHRDSLASFLRNKVSQRNGPAATLFGTGKYKGITLAEASQRENMPFEDLLIDSIGPSGASGAYFVMDQELQDTFILDSLVMICSDGSPTGSHPRGHGTFAKIIQHYVVEQELMPLEYAIYKMTGLSAKTIGIENRGLLKEGYHADLLVFDPKEIKAKADYEAPLQLAEGFHDIVINGKWVRQNGKFTGIRNGKLLRK